MSIACGNVMPIRTLVQPGGTWCWCIPRIEISANFNKVLHELANLIVVHAKNLAFFCSTQTEERNNIDDLGEDSGHNEDVCGASADVGELDIELLVVVLDPTTWNGGVNTVKGDERCIRKEAVGEKSEDATDSVLSEQIESVINTNQILD
jgi:hypothetical protein